MTTLSRNLFLAVFTFLALSCNAWAFKVPALTGPVMDEAGLLSANARAQIDDLIRRIYNNKAGPQLQVFITSSLQGETIEEVAIQIFDQWKLGDEKKDNGILFIVAPNERKLRIEVGQGLEGDVPDVIAKRIIADIVTPYFKRGEFDMGVYQGVTAIANYLNATPEQKQQMQQARQSSGQLPGIIGFMLNNPIIFVFLIFFLLRLLGGGRRGGIGYFPIGFGGGGGGFGGGAFGGGGGWGGGGGSSSGGGASGGW